MRILIAILLALFTLSSCQAFKKAKCTECPEWTETENTTHQNLMGNNSYCE